MRSTKIVNVDTLMLADASCIESDTSWISDKDWKEMLPTGSSLGQIESQLESGESVVLSDSPRSPLFTLSQGEWIKSVSASSAFPSCAVTAITQRFNAAGSSIAFERSPGESLPPSPQLDYTPDTSTVKEQVLPISCQYNVEIACTPQHLDTLNYGYFMLAKTKNEPSLALSTVKPLGKHSLLTALGKFEEPKQLLHMLTTGKSSQLSVKPVKMVPLGSQQVYESFVPVQLAVQVGERLGYPIRGYFYHFKQGQLVHEYAIVEGAKGYFNITHSTANALSDEVNIPALRGSIFLPWKINGQQVTPQHIYYSKKKLTAEMFQSIDGAWLNTNAVPLDLGAILAANQQVLLARTEEQKGQPPQAPQAVSRADNIYYQSSTPELAPGVIGITKQSVLKDVAVLNLGEIEDTSFNLGWFQCEAETPQSTLFDDLLKDASNPELKAFLLKYNQHLNEPVRTGEIILLPTTEPVTEQDKQAIKDLQAEAEAASKELSELSDVQLQLHQNHFEVLDNKFVEYLQSGMPTDNLSYMGVAAGTIAPAMQKNLGNVSSSLQKVDALYLKLLAKKIDRQTFLNQRRELEQVLNKQLDKLSQKTLKIPIDEGIKKSLGIKSTKSLIHNADEILRQGTVSELGKRVANTAKWVRLAENAGKVGLGLGVASGVYNVTQNCNGLESCVHQTVVETGGIAGGWAGGMVGSVLAGTLVVSLAISSAPVVMLVVGSAVLVGGTMGAGVGKDVFESFYEMFKLNEFLEKIEDEAEINITEEIEQYIIDARFNNFSINSAF